MPNLTAFGNRLVDPGEISRENISRNQALADVMRQSTANPNIQHPAQGLALLANALNAQIYRQRAQRGDEALKKQEAEKLGQLMQSLNLNPQQQALLGSLSANTREGVLGNMAVQQFTEEESPSRIGQRIVNGEFEAEIYQDDQGPFYYSDSQGGKTRVSSRALTTPPERQETGGPGAFDPRTRSQQGEAVTKFQDAAIGGTGAIQTAAQLVGISRNTPEALGAPGFMLRVGNEFVRTAESLGGLLGVDVGADRDVGGFDFTSFAPGSLRNAAIESQAFRAGVFGVAFAAAVAEQGSRPTDKDIQAFIDQIGGSTADPRGFERTIQTFVDRINRRIRTTANVKNIPEEIRSAAYGELDSALGDFNQFFQADSDGIPEGVPPELWELMTPEERALWQ